MAPAPQVDPFAEALQRCLSMDGPLNAQLAAFAEAVADYSPDFAAAVETLVARLKKFDVGAAAPGPGDPMPPFALPDEHGHFVDLAGLLAQGPAVVIFHRGHWCPYCRINSVALARAQGRIREAGGRMVAIMPDLPPFSERFKATAGADFPVLTDIDNGYAMSMNLVFWVNQEMQQFIHGAGIEVPRYQGNDGWLLPIPATFVVGQDGCIAARHVDPDYRKRLEIEELVAAVARAAGR